MTHLSSAQPTRRGARTSGSTHLILVILLSALAAAPLLKPGYFWGAHDARHDVYFIFQYLRAMNDGHWLARWSPEFSFGYGYPFFLIYGPLTSFLGALLVKFAGLGYTQAVELLFGASDHRLRAGDVRLRPFLARPQRRPGRRRGLRLHPLPPGRGLRPGQPGRIRRPHLAPPHPLVRPRRLPIHPLHRRTPPSTLALLTRSSTAPSPSSPPPSPSPASC